MPNILFRADAHNKIGTGDLVSFIYLSHEFQRKDWGVFFSIRDFSVAKQIVENWHLKNVHWITSDLSINDEVELIRKLCLDEAVDCFFIQITDGSLTEYKDLNRVAPIMACVNFDGCVLVDFDLIVNWCVDLKESVYEEYKGGNLLCGFENAILPDYFDRDKICKRSYGDFVRKILITMGGIDEFNLTRRILEALRCFDKEFEIRVVIGPGCTLNDKASFSGVVFKENSCNLFEDYLWADIAFSSGGLTSSELAATRTPAILISAYTHQIKRCEYYARQGWAYYLGGQEGIIADNIRNGLNKVVSGIADYRIALARSAFRGGSEKIFKIIDSYRQSKKLA